MDPTMDLPPPPADAEYVVMPTVRGRCHCVCCWVFQALLSVVFSFGLLWVWSVLSFETFDDFIEGTLPITAVLTLLAFGVLFCFRRCHQQRAKKEATALEQAIDRRITYEGNVRAGNRFCVASFPGKYGDEWNQVIGVERSSVACVFMQQGGRGFGRHIRPKSRCGALCQGCYCQKLYGCKTEFGCYWFGKWMDNVKEAVRAQQSLVVFFFKDEKHLGVPDSSNVPWARFERGTGLGSSQKGEVAWLRSKGIHFESRDMGEWKLFVETQMAVEQ